MSARETIIEEMQRVASEQKKTLVPLHDTTPLLTVGLDSLCFAILVARLDETLGVDPFSASDEVMLPVTFGDLVNFYDHARV